MHLRPTLASPLRLRPLKYPTYSRRFLQTMMIRNNGPEAANKFVDFVNASPTPFHAVRQASIRLEKAGFQKVIESNLDSVILIIDANLPPLGEGNRRLGEESKRRRKVLLHEARTDIPRS